MARVTFGCFCGTEGNARVAADGRPVYAECPDCGFVYRITRTQTQRGIAQQIRPSKCGRKALDIQVGGETIHVAPGTLFPEEA